MFEVNKKYSSENRSDFTVDYIGKTYMVIKDSEGKVYLTDLNGKFQDKHNNLIKTEVLGTIKAGTKFRFVGNEEIFTKASIPYYIEIKDPPYRDRTIYVIDSKGFLGYTNYDSDVILCE